MKKRLLLILSVLLPTMLMASPIGKEEAKEKALSFLNGRSSAKARGLNSVKALRLVKSEPCYYVFNIGSRDGFVIVSGDDCAPEILGYADSGEVDPQNMPENMKAWLQGYADQIEWMKEKGIKAQTRSIAKAGAKSAIEPLLKSEWNQYSPFNDQCPTYTKDAETKHYVTGCVATAMAQIMYYHKWPEACTAIPQYTPTGANASCPTLPALESTTFDWAKMCDTYNGSEDGTEVAKLFKYCGTAVQMNYAEGGSSASTGTAVYALMNYFGYSSGARYLGRSGYTYAQWIDIIYGELAAGRPVLYDGQSTGGGHAFVCDGYEEDDLFHINWGWGGQSNGVFRLSILAPEEQGAGGSSTSDGYRMWQSIGVGIEKTNTSPSYPEPANTNPSLEVTSFAIDGGSLTTNTANNITLRITNNSDTESFHDDITIALLNSSTLSSGILQKLGGTMTDIEPGKTKEFTISVSPKYYGDNIPLGVIKGYFEYGTLIGEARLVNIQSGTPSATSSDVALTFSINIQNATEEAGTKYILGNKIKASITVNNNTETNYQGFIGAYLLNRSTGYTNTGSVPSITVNANSSTTITVERDVEYDKQYSIYPAYFRGKDTNGNDVWGEDDATKNIIYTAKRAIASYQSDGTETLALAKETYNVPANAAVVDLRGQSTVTSVTPNANPNCIYLLDGSAAVPSGITSNIVKGSTAESISLTDGYNFYTPIDFTATNISYTRTFTTGYTVSSGKAAGWSTICLPFNVNTVKTGDKTLEWFTNSTDTKKHFWLAEFKSDNASNVTFDYAQNLNANTPYIIAIPGSQWGDTWKLTGKAITFSGTNANIKANAKATQSGSYLKFSGTTKSQTLTSIYNLNAEGSKFEKGDATVGAFRAYFSNTSMGSTAASLGIIFGDGTATGISTIKTQSENADTIYDLRGQKVGSANQLNSLPKGIYIINGKKIIK